MASLRALARSVISNGSSYPAGAGRGARLERGQAADQHVAPVAVGGLGRPGLGPVARGGQLHPDQPVRVDGRFLRGQRRRQLAAHRSASAWRGAGGRDRPDQPGPLARRGPASGRRGLLGGLLGLAQALADCVGGAGAVAERAPPDGSVAPITFASSAACAR